MPLDLFHLNSILLPIMKINIENNFYFIRAILEQKVCSDKSLQKVAIHLLGHRRAIARKHWRLLKSKRGVWTALDSRRNQDRLVGGGGFKRKLRVLNMYGNKLFQSSISNICEIQLNLLNDIKVHY